MKKILLIVVLCVVAYIGCKKAEKLESNLVSVDEETIVVEDDNATITASYTYNYTIKSSKIIYSTNNNLSSAQSQNITAENGHIVVYLDNLQKRTTYYYCFEFYSGYNTMSTEINSFTTLGAVLPQVETADIHDITMTTAIGGGNVVNDGSDEITARGVCWNTLENPTIDNNHTSDGTGVGAFVSNISDLNENTIYYIRAYAKNSAGIGYGAQKVFKTQQNPAMPTVTTNDVTDITETGALCGGIVSSEGTSSVVARGVCWSSSDEPFVTDNHTVDGNGLGQFVSVIDNLEPNTNYYVKAYATNSFGTSYGEIKTFTTNQILSTPIVITNAEVLNITPFSASCGGTIISDGNSPIISKGICWSLSPDPTTNNFKTDEGPGMSSFTSVMSGLEQNTVYYVKAYAINGIGTSYGDQREFTTLINQQLPLVTTDIPSEIGLTSARCGGSVTDDGNAEVYDRGICWSLYDYPTITDNVISMGNGIGAFSDIIEGLDEETRYYVRAYATNVMGTNYGDSRSFITGHSVVGPTVVTKEVTEITQTDASTGGNVVSDGGGTVSSRGVCYSTHQNPTLEDEVKQSGFGTGEFDCHLDYLESGTTYYVRAYATNEIETSYGQQEMFTTALDETLPTVITAEVSNIELTSAVCGGNVTDDGNLPVTARGICWSTHPQPSLEDSFTEDGEGLGSFESLMEFLNPNTTYFVRAYATNSKGTAYGEDKEFQTPTDYQLPTVLTDAPSDIGVTSARCGGIVTDDGNSEVTNRGVCWSLADPPTIDDNVMQMGSGIGSFSEIIEGFEENTRYYVRAYAINMIGTNYGDSRTFITGHNVVGPTVITKVVTDITETTAMTGGEVTSDGGAEIIERGVCYGINQNPTINDMIVQSGSGIGEFDCLLENLDSGVTYYVRAYATNEVETAYGQQETFTTDQEQSLPIVETSEVTNIGQTSATCGGNVLSDGNSTVTARGVCWSRSQNPTIANSHTTDGTGMGQFVSNITNLQRNTTYYVRAYATNGVGTAYGEQKVLTTDMPEVPEGALNGLFSVSPDKQVFFSQGCLKYQASTRIWRLADNQYDYVGNDNHNISPTYSGWIDTYCWGTSGWNSGANQYQPWATSTNDADYCPGGSTTTDLTGDYINADWSFYNAIENAGNQSGLWRTLTNDEWAYLIETRNNNPLYGNGQTTNNYLSFKCQLTIQGTQYIGVMVLADNDSENAQSSNYANTSWSSVPQLTGIPEGAAFLVGGPNRQGTTIIDIHSYGNYYSTTHASSTNAYYLNFNQTGMLIQGVDGRHFGFNVRPVAEIDNPYPKITTNNVSNVNGNSATCGGSVISQGSSGVTARGVCWSSDHTPSISDPHTTDGSGMGSFSSNITGLSPATTYYVRAYATNSYGTVYGNEHVFTTIEETQLPTVITDIPSEIGTTSARCGGNVTDDGNSTVYERGVCWGFNDNPTINDNKVQMGAGVGQFSQVLYGFEDGSCYYIRAYASNSAGTAYGSVVHLSTNAIQNWSDGILPGLFSVSATNIINFSQGNLQYNADRNIWRFANHQWEYVGTEVAGTGNTGGNVCFSSNHLVSSSYDGWIDLFGWGTSSYNHGAVCYLPYSTSQNNADYYAYGSLTYNLNDQNGTADWGYNPISNGGNMENQWRTLTKDEWNYVFNYRNTTSGIRFAMARIDDVNGVILLPDNWNINCFNLNNTNNYDALYTDNIISFSSWINVLEINGAVFLPAAGLRMGVNINFIGSYGYYWTSTYLGDNHSYSVTNGGINGFFRYQGLSVRLVRDTESPYPTVTTNNPTNFTQSTATCGGNVTSQGASAVTARGVCWSTTQYPTISDSHTADGTGIGSFTSIITGLTPGTEYYVRAYATNSYGTAYGDNILFYTMPQSNAPEGAIDGLYTVDNNGSQVYFSRGNLQYQASTSTWRFATNQYDFIASGNQNVSPTYSGWIDTFGWATSGYNHGAVCYQPWSISTTVSDYYAYGNNNYNLNDQNGQADWGYNAISNGGNTENTWRTLTNDEWFYVFNSRNTSSGIRYAKAKVNNVNGVILLPDDWNASIYNIVETNNPNASYTSNVINSSVWNNTFEYNGAVFIAAAGWRNGTMVGNLNNSANYWSATHKDASNAWRMWFDDGDFNASSNAIFNWCFTVRLVQDAE